jgi:hypothetical protein
MLAAPAVVLVPGRASAAHAVPWRFTSVVDSSQVDAFSNKGWVLQCPAGYTAVSGGMNSVTHPSGPNFAALYVHRLLEYPNPADGTYHILVRNDDYLNVTVSVKANCVWLDDVGSISTVTTEFARNGSGRAGGILRCPAGTSVLSGGVDWSTTNSGRTIDYSTPITDGTSLLTGWYVAGYSPVAGVLAIELRCVSSSLLSGAYATANDSTAASPGVGDITATCGSGTRILTGGAGPAGTKNPGSDQGQAFVSGPSSSPSSSWKDWRTTAYQASGVTLRALALCVPASAVSASFTQTPPDPSSSSGTITFTASDSTGEALTYVCRLNGNALPCSSGNPVSWGPLADGKHEFTVTVGNQSGDSELIGFNWTTDAAVPVVSDHTPTTDASLTAPFMITFSEWVEGVTASSVVVHAQSANANVSGTIGRPSPTVVTWTPTARLVPGETYNVSLTSAIHDYVGNPLAATSFSVRTTTIVENTSAALQRRWDVDRKSIASGGAYIVSRLAGSRAERTFTASAGQRVSVYGIRLPGGGYAAIYLDGKKVAKASFYAASSARGRVYRSPSLKAGTHTISIRPLGTKPSASSNSWVAIDKVVVGGSVKQETWLEQRFRRVSTASAYGGSYDTMTQANGTDKTPAQVQLTMVGTGVKVYATRTSASGRARVYIDGVLRTTLDLNRASTSYKALVYSTTFGLGVHTLRIEAVGTRTGAKSSVNLDRITID